MQADDTNKHDDLEYLAQRGYEGVPVDDSDLQELNKRIRRRVHAGPFYLAAGSLVVGAVIGASLFLGLKEQSQQATAEKSARTSTDQQAAKPSTGTPTIFLDTILVEKENFINPEKQLQPAAEVSVSAATRDSVEVIVSKPVDLTLLNQGPIKEAKLRYMANAPVFYLHDMKVTSYTTLYFKKNHFVKLSGLSAAYSGTAETAPAGSGLKQSADYYLHEEIASAMRQFGKGNYEHAIQSLKIISTYNDHDPNCEFYLAMSYYYIKNYARALEFFERSITNPNNTFLQEAEYYQALTYRESGREEEAKRLFKKIKEEEGFYSQKAETFLEN